MCSAPEDAKTLEVFLDISGRIRLKIKIEHQWWLYKKLIFFRLHQEQKWDSHQMGEHFVQFVLKPGGKKIHDFLKVE